MKSEISIRKAFFQASSGFFPDGASSRKWFLVDVSLSMFYWGVRSACEDADRSSDDGSFKTSQSHLAAPVTIPEF